MPLDINSQQLESKAPVAREEIPRTAEAAWEDARDARARAHQAADRTRKITQKTEDIIQHRRARREHEAEAQLLLPSADAFASTASPLHGARLIEILLVEDNPADVRLLEELLKRLAIPFHLQAVERGEEALAFLRHEGPYAQTPRPDVIFLDLHLPGMDGVEVFAAVQTDPFLREIPVAVFSGTDIEKERLAAVGPVIAYLRKTLTPEPAQYVEVLEKIRQGRREKEPDS
jgi:CheY-like chemotaxis protein